MYKLSFCVPFAAILLLLAGAPVQAQVVEAVGSRALGMGGAFVAVADDSSATWWNPAGLAAGPFVDLALARAVTELHGDTPRRDRVTWFALGTPPVGISYYRLRVTDIRPDDSTGRGTAGREDRRVELPARSLAASQIGVTLVQSVATGVHLGTTLKYVRGTVVSGVFDASLDPGDLLDAGQELDGGDARGTFDLDVGALAVAGAVRLGLVVRNIREPEFRSGEGDAVALQRQVRVGAAFDAREAGGRPLVVAVDADLRTTDTAAGERRAVAVGGEHWFFDRRLGVRGGGRFNTVGGQERSATAGVSVGVRSGLFLDAHVVRGGSVDERGWGVAARVSF